MSRTSAIAAALFVAVASGAVLRGCDGAESQSTMTREGLDKSSRPFVPPSRRTADLAVAHVRDSAPETAEADVTVRDLWTGEPVGLVGFRVVTAGGIEHFQTSASVTGLLHLPRDSKISIERSGEGWRLLQNFSSDDARLARTLWVLRDGRILVTVKSADGGAIDYRQVVLAAVPGGELRTKAETAIEPPWNPEWLRAHGLSRTELGRPLDETGSAVVALPAVRGICIHATAPGWNPSFQSVPRTADAVANVVMTLSRTAFVSGVVRSESGGVIPHAKVVVYATRTGRFADFGDDELAVYASDRGGYSAGWSKKDDTAEATFVSNAETDEHGQFKVEVRISGRVLVVVYPPDHRRIVQDIGLIEADRGGLVLVGRSAPDPGSLKIVHKGTALANCQVAVSDVGRDDQPALSFTTSADGVIETLWIDVGCRYAVVPMGTDVAESIRRAHFFTYLGQAEIDLSELSTDVNKR